MSDYTSIEWTDATWNIVTGCSVVSPGCVNCYAMKLAGTHLQHHPSRAGLTKPYGRSADELHDARTGGRLLRWRRRRLARYRTGARQIARHRDQSRRRSAGDARGGIPRQAPRMYGRSPQRDAWLWGWDHERAA